jgi:hypothetical protein
LDFSLSVLKRSTRSCNHEVNRDELNSTSRLDKDLSIHNVSINKISAVVVVSSRTTRKSSTPNLTLTSDKKLSALDLKSFQVALTLGWKRVALAILEMPRLTKIMRRRTLIRSRAEGVA